jgi:biopolymer transport protein ExbD
MGAVDLAGPSSKGKKKGLRRPKRRISVRLDMTPMVDIAFLLLIFYMVSTVFSEPQAMEINLPPETEVPVKESKVLTLRIDEYNTLYWNLSQVDPVPIPFDSLSPILISENQETADLITLIKIHKLAKYSMMVDIIDDIEVIELRFKQSTPGFSYRFSMAPWTNGDQKIVERVRAAYEGLEGTPEEVSSP